MFRQVTLSEFHALRRMLRAGLRHTEIARELDLSPWTVSRLAGERRFQEDGLYAEDYGEDLAEEVMPEDDAPPDYLSRNLRRCQGCGAMVYLWPCPACQMATMTQPVPPAPEVDDEPEDEQPGRLTAKQRRWRRKQLVERIFGDGTSSDGT